MPGEFVRDERPQDPEQAFKVNTYIPALVSVQTEFTNRFTETTVDIMREMQYFMPHFLLSDRPDIQDSDIEKLCKFYQMNSTTMARELA